MTTPGPTQALAGDFPPYYATYVSQVPPGPVTQTLERQAPELQAFLAGVTEAQAGQAYAPGKWTLRQVVGHVLDTERVLAYRLLRAARGDARTPLAGYDDEAWAATWDVSALPLPALGAEFQAVRASTVALLRHLGEQDWDRRVEANGGEFTVRGLAFIIAGHERHHRRILQERYLNAPA